MNLVRIWFAGLLAASALRAAEPIPDRLVVLTFDDASASHATFVAPLLKKFGFTATFFVCEFPPDFDDKTKYPECSASFGRNALIRADNGKAGKCNRPKLARARGFA